MRIVLYAETVRYSKVSEPITIPDGLTDYQIDDLVQDDLAEMAVELVDIWWERETEGDQ